MKSWKLHEACVWESGVEVVVGASLDGGGGGSGMERLELDADCGGSFESGSCTLEFPPSCDCTSLSIVMIVCICVSIT